MNLNLIEEIKKYIKNDRINYAILIDGEWGSGKTFFIKEELISKLNEDIINNGGKPTLEYKKPIYISLYGIDSLDSVSAQIYLQITGKYSKIVSLGLSTLKVVKPDLNYSKIFETLNENFNLKNYVLIFDDLERANLDINICLAYINSFVEHHGIKVIIIANESEIGKLDFNKNYELKLLSTMQSDINYEDPKKKDLLGKPIDTTKPNVSIIKERVERLYEINYNYRLIKEKLIGKTYKYIPNLNTIIDNLMNVYKYDNDYYLFLKEHKKTLIDKLNLYTCSNLRTIKCIFEDFYDLYLKLKEANIKSEKEMHLKIYINFIIYIINIKAGNKMLNWTDNVKYQTTCFGNDDHQSIIMYFLAFKFVDDYILNKNIDIKEIEKTINEYINNEENEFENSNSAFFELECYWELDDDKLSELLKILKDELNNDQYPCSVFPKIVVTLSSLQNLKFETKLIDEIITVMEEKIDKNLSRKYYINYDQIIRNESILNIYNKNIERLKLASKKRNNTISNNSLESILNDDEWGINLYNYIGESENYNYFFENKEFLSKLNIEKIINNIDKSNNRNIYNFKYCIDRMYRFGNYYNNDKKAFEELINGISKLKKDKYGVTKKDAVNNLECTLLEKFELL